MDKHKKAMIRELHTAIIDIESRYHDKVNLRGSTLGYSIDKLKSCLLHDVFAAFMAADGIAEQKDTTEDEEAEEASYSPFSTEKVPDTVKSRKRYVRVPDSEMAKYAGKMTDAAAASILGCSPGKVWTYRTDNNIPFFRKTKKKNGSSAVSEDKKVGVLVRKRKKPGPSWTDERIAIIGTMPDKDAAAILNLNTNTVYKKRAELGIKTHQQSLKIMQENVDLLGSFNDEELAYMLDIPRSVVTQHRKQKTLDEKLADR